MLEGMDHSNNGSLHQRGSARCRSPARSRSPRCRSTAPSYESMKSDWSMDPPYNFKGVVPHPGDSCDQRVSPVPSCVSVKSDWSLDIPCNFKEGAPHPDSSWLQKQSSDCPSPSCVSMKSGKSMDHLQKTDYLS